MSIHNILSNPALKPRESMELNEEWNNFVKRIGEVSVLVKDLASGDKEKADAAKVLADQYLEGKVIENDNVHTKVKDNRTVINQKAFQRLDTKDKGEIEKEAWMAEMARDAERRTVERKIRKERADTLKTQAAKAFHRGDYERALSYFNRAIEQVKDNSMLYCDRALVNIKLGNYRKVFKDCERAIQLNECSFKGHLYKAKAYKELNEEENFNECKKELDKMFPQHNDLVQYFLNKKQDGEENEDYSE